LIFQFARVFQEKNAKPPPPKFSLPYKKILNPLPQKISGYAPEANQSNPVIILFTDSITFLSFNEQKLSNFFRAESLLNLLRNLAFNKNFKLELTGNFSCLTT